MSAAVAMPKPNGHALAVAAVPRKRRRAKKPAAARRAPIGARSQMVAAIKGMRHDGLQYHDVLANAALLVIQHELAETKGNKTRAAKRLGVRREWLHAVLREAKERGLA